MGSDGESQADVHSAGITFNGCVKKVLDVSERDYLLELPFDLGASHT